MKEKLKGIQLKTLRIEQYFVSFAFAYELDVNKSNIYFNGIPCGSEW